MNIYKHNSQVVFHSHIHLCIYDDENEYHLSIAYSFLHTHSHKSS